MQDVCIVRLFVLLQPCQLAKLCTQRGGTRTWWEGGEGGVKRGGGAERSGEREGVGWGGVCVWGGVSGWEGRLGGREGGRQVCRGG